MFAAQENTSVYEPGYQKAITWKEFKEKHEDWDFGESDPDRHDFEEKAQKAWKKVGPRFCKSFRTTFTEYGEQSASTPRSRHYLLILDASRSMNEKGKWTGVVEAVNQMARSESELALESKFSVILFSFSAKVVMSNCTASEILESKFGPPFKGTNFANAFQCAADFVRETDFADHCPMVVFMTDGEDLHREQHVMDTEGLGGSRKAAIRNLVGEFNDKQQPWDFRAIAYGSSPDFDLLEEIAEKHVGRAAESSKYMEASSALDLVQVLALPSFAFCEQRNCMELFNQRLVLGSKISRDTATLSEAFLEIAQSSPNVPPAGSHLLRNESPKNFL
jgi:Mg-chelatase subunit ChlD